MLRVSKIILLLFFIAISLIRERGEARPVYYLEEFYNLYYLPNKFENQDLTRNIYWLQFATNRPFAPPIFALIPHQEEIAYQKYQLLLKMNIHYLIIKNTVFLAARFDKHKPVFFNRPYKEDILKSLKIAEYLYSKALKEWENVLFYHKKISDDPKFKGVRSKLSFLDDMIYRIEVKELDYQRVIERKLDKIKQTEIYFSKNK